MWVMWVKKNPKKWLNIVAVSAVNIFKVINWSWRELHLQPILLVPVIDEANYDYFGLYLMILLWFKFEL